MEKRKESRQQFANRIINYYEREGHFSKIQTVNHFKDEGKLKTVIYRILRRYEERGTATYRKSCGRSRSRSTPENLHKLGQLLAQDPTMSLEELSHEMGIPRSTVNEMKTKYLRLKGGGGVAATATKLGSVTTANKNKSITNPKLIAPISKVMEGIPEEENLPEHAKLDGACEKEGGLEEEHVWQDTDPFQQDTFSEEQSGSGPSSSSTLKDPKDKGNYQFKETPEASKTLPIRTTCLLCRQKIVKQIRITSRQNTTVDQTETTGTCTLSSSSSGTSLASGPGIWKALCLESLSMLFGLEANHPLIAVFAGSGTSTRGNICNRCLQDLANVHFIFWQLQNLEKKLSELQLLIYTRLLFNYEQVPDPIIFGRFIGVEELRRDLHKLNYDHIVKSIFEEVKSRKTEWPKSEVASRWREACQNAKIISDSVTDHQEDDVVEYTMNKEEDFLGSYHQDDNDNISSSPSDPSTTNPPIKIEVDPEDINPDEEIADELLTKLEVNPLPRPTSETQVRKRLSKKVRKIDKKFKAEPEDLQVQEDHLAGAEKDPVSDNDQEWTIEKNTQSSKPPQPKIKRKRGPKPSGLPKTKRLHKRVHCNEDPSECQKTFYSRKLMLDHVHKHHKINRFACDHPGCSGRFKSEDFLSRHRELLHGILRPKIMCELCGMEVYSQEMREHIYLNHRGLGDFKCEHCSIDFTDPSEFENHQQLHREYPFSCVMCNLPFTNWSELQSHVQTNHLFSNGVKCNICGVRKPNQDLLQRHLKLHAKPKCYMCSECGKSFAAPRLLKLHDKICHSDQSGRVNCDVCGKGFKREKYMKHHRSTSHPDHAKRFFCTLCPSIFQHFYILKQHQKTHETSNNLASSSTTTSSPTQINQQIPLPTILPDTNFYKSAF